MRFEYKILPLSRKSGDSSRLAESTPPCLELDARLFTELLATVGFEDGVPSMANTFAQVLGEMLGADVYYRPVGFTDWRFERGYLPLSAEYRERRKVKEYADEIAYVLESVDNRAMAADGPVTPTKNEITGDEFRKIYKAARAIVAACAFRDKAPPEPKKRARKKK